MVTNSGFFADGRAVTIDSLAKVANGDSLRNHYEMVTIEVSDDLEIRKLGTVINELAAAGFGEIGIVSSSNKALSAVIELALSDNYKVHWQYATEVSRAQTMDKTTGYDAELDIASVVISLDEDKIRMEGNTVGEQEFRELLKKLRVRHQRVAVHLVLDQAGHNVLKLIRTLALIEQEGCKATLSIGPE